jgi:hypothetical protein
MDRVHGLRSMGLDHSEMILAVEEAMDSQDLISWRVIFWSNPGHLVAAGSSVSPACDGTPWELAGGRRPAAPKLRLQWGFILWHRSDVGRLFRSPLNGGRRWWCLATERWFGQDLTTWRVTCSASPMTWTTLMGVADLREAPRTVGLARAATPAWRWGRVAG